MSDEERVAPPGLVPAHVCEGGNLDCGSGLLLIIRKAMDEVPVGEILEIRSTEISVRADLPAWCRMTKNPYLGWQAGDGHNKFFVRRGEPGDESRLSYEQARQYRWQVRTRWSGGLAASVYARNHTWQIGQPASFDVRDDAPSAVEALLGALGASLAMGLQMSASMQNVVIDEIEISLSSQIDNIFVFLGTENTGHSGFGEISGTAYVQSEAEEATLQALWEETLRVSPVLNTLARPAQVHIALRAI